jgi:nitrous oxidase accessory protein NosD
VFSEAEARVIVGIPLSLDLPPDRMVWRGTTNGSFTVKSAYHLGKETQALEGGKVGNF